MPAFKRFGPADQIDNVLVLHPEYSLVSGSQGWSGSPEGSASLYLYGGARRRPGVFSQLEYQSFAPTVRQVGNPKRSQPLTSSVSLAYVTDESLNFTQVTRTRWGEEHWDVIQRLYQDYRVVDPDYVTGSYDYYSLMFKSASSDVLSYVMRDAGGTTIRLSSSFTLEAWVKPLVDLGPAQARYVVHGFSQGEISFGVTGSNGCLYLTSSAGAFTSSIGPTTRRWSHVAVSFDGQSLTGTFYVNLTEAGRFSFGSAIPGNSTATGYVGSIGAATTASAGAVGSSFDGLLFEPRVWTATRSYSDLSGSYARRLSPAELGPCAAYFPTNEGPLFTGLTVRGGVVGAVTQGSGAINLADVARNGTNVNGVLLGFSDRVGPVWHPNDNVTFRPPKRLADSTVVSYSGSDATYSLAPVRRMLVVDVPAAFHGRQVVPGSVRMTCRAVEGFGLVRTLVDDARGGLYLSGSACSSSLETREDYAGVGWNKVGNVFYGEGLIVVRDQSLLDFGRTDVAALAQESTFSLRFRGDSRVPVKTLMCRIDHGEFNCTTNPTFYVTGSAGERLRRHPSGSIRVSTVGLYNSDRELVGIARLADLVRIRARDRINIRIRMDF